MDNEPQLSSISLPLKTRIQLRFLNVVTDFVRRHDGTINRRLMNFLDRKVPPNPIPLNGVKSYDITVDAARDLWFRLFIPANVPENVVSLPVLVFFHGGGFAFLSAGSYSYDAVCRRFARRLNAVVVSVNYRLSPEHKFPSQYDDGFDVLRKINDDRRNIKVWPEKADVSKCYLAGDSAGGNIAHNVTVRALQSNLTEVKIIGLINIQPFFGGKERMESEIRLEGAPIVSIARTDWMWRAFLPDGLDMDHWAVNVSGPNAVDVSGMAKFPTTMVVVGGFDPLLDWQRRYYEWLKRCGKDVRLVEYPTACHAFYVFPDVPESSVLIKEVKEFLRNSVERAGAVE